MTAVGLTAAPRVSTGAGTATGRDLAGPAAVSSGTGAITLAFRRPVSAFATTGDGDVAILPDDPTSPERLTARTVRGNITLSPP